MQYARIASTGSYLPQRVVSNADLPVDTTDEWIVTRTGIESRHVAAEGEMTSDLAFKAAQAALQAGGFSVDDIDLIVVATTTPDMVFPSTACLLQEKLGVPAGAAAYDVQAVCTGFIYALSSANALIRIGQHKRALVVGSEVFSRILDWNDRRTCVLFGDGAGAVVLEASDAPGILSAHLHADGSQGDILRVSASLSGGEISGHPFLEMDGQAVFKLAVKVLHDVALEALSHNNMAGADLDWFIPHQANLRIIRAMANKLNVANEKVVTTVHKHGNTSAASVPLALDTAVRDGRLQRGQHALLEGVGGGMTWGSVLLRY